MAVSYLLPGRWADAASHSYPSLYQKKGRTAR
jgi:hypothetical protein